MISGRALARARPGPVGRLDGGIQPVGRCDRSPVHSFVSGRAVAGARTGPVAGPEGCVRQLPVAIPTGPLRRGRAIRAQSVGTGQAGVRIGRPDDRDAVPIREKALGPDHAEVAISLNNLAAMYQVQGRYAEAVPLFRRSLAIWEKALGPKHPIVAQSLGNYAVLLRETGRTGQVGGPRPAYRIHFGQG